MLVGVGTQGEHVGKGQGVKLQHVPDRRTFLVVPTPSEMVVNPVKSRFEHVVDGNSRRVEYEADEVVFSDGHASLRHFNLPEIHHRIVIQTVQVSVT